MKCIEYSIIEGSTNRSEISKRSIRHALKNPKIASRARRLKDVSIAFQRLGAKQRKANV